MPALGNGTQYAFQQLRVGDLLVTGEADIGYDTDNYGNLEWEISSVTLSFATDGELEDAVLPSKRAVIDALYASESDGIMEEIGEEIAFGWAI